MTKTRTIEHNQKQDDIDASTHVDCLPDGKFAWYLVDQDGVAIAGDWSGIAFTESAAHDAATEALRQFDPERMSVTQYSLDEAVAHFGDMVGFKDAILDHVTRSGFQGWTVTIEGVCEFVRELPAHDAWIVDDTLHVEISVMTDSVMTDNDGCVVANNPQAICVAADGTELDQDAFDSLDDEGFIATNSQGIEVLLNDLRDEPDTCPRIYWTGCYYDELAS